jgi:hypothetical protein
MSIQFMVQRGRKVLEDYVRNDVKWKTEVQGVMNAVHEGLIFTAGSRPALKSTSSVSLWVHW